MNYWLDILGCGLTTLGILLVSIIIGLFIFLTVQLISYRIFNFNLYKWLNYILIERELNK